MTFEAGRIALSGDDLMTLDEAGLGAIRGRRVAMVFQDAATALDPVQTLGGHLREALAAYGFEGDPDKRIMELFETVRLPDPRELQDRYPHEVSGGEKQRVVLALAFAANPDLILFDEPTSALDATTAATLLDLIRDLKQRTGFSALFISHDLGAVSAVADRVAVMYGGRVVEEGAGGSAILRTPPSLYARSSCLAPATVGYVDAPGIEHQRSQSRSAIHRSAALYFRRQLSASCAGHLRHGAGYASETGRPVACLRARRI